MTTATAPHLPESGHRAFQLLPSVRSERLKDSAYQAYVLLRTAFVVAPILFGIDKYFNWMTFSGPSTYGSASPIS